MTLRQVPLPFQPPSQPPRAPSCTCAFPTQIDTADGGVTWVHVETCPAVELLVVEPRSCLEPAGQKLDQGKPRWDLLPPKALHLVVLVLTFGARKYAPDNWRHVDGWRWRYFRAALGHLWSWWRGEARDQESGLPHLAHAACCVLFLLDLEP